jgi:hypothetical protein
MTSLNCRPCIRIQSPFTRCHQTYHKPQTPHLVSAAEPGHSKPHHYIITLQPLLGALHSSQAACRLRWAGLVGRSYWVLNLHLGHLVQGIGRWYLSRQRRSRTVVSPLLGNMPASTFCSSSAPLSPSAGTGYGNTTMSELWWLSQSTATA